MPNCYPNGNRLKKTVEFRRVFRSARKVDLATMSTYTTMNAHAVPRIGIVIAKKQVAKATERNRIKRIIRESFRLEQHGLKPVDIILLIKRETKNLSNHALRIELNKVWKRVASTCVKD